MGVMGVLLIFIGVGLAVVGVVLVILDRLGGGDLPGDVRFQVGNVLVSAPCMTMLIISVVGSILLTLVVNVILRLLNR